MMIWSPVWLWPRARGPGAGLSFAAVVCSEPGWLRATPPLTAHPPPHQRITRPLIPCEQRVQAFPLSLRHQLGLGQQSAADPPPALGLRGSPVGPDVGPRVPHGPSFHAFANTPNDVAVPSAIHASRIRRSDTPTPVIDPYRSHTNDRTRRTSPRSPHANTRHE